ncbi:MAG: hypothetical protein MUF40_04020 [Gemmatimonadaceae bacterium]|jgi:hypothetical protein|nr:hypothetical protein [Gemmatimonadaceae bacterium]
MRLRPSFALATAVLAPCVLAAQGAPADSAVRAAPPVPPALVASPAAIADTIEAGLVARGLDAIRGERDGFLVARREAETRWAERREAVQRTRTEIAQAERAREAAEEKSRAARKSKQDAERAAADQERRRIERTLLLLRATIEVREAEAELGRIERDAADAAVRAADAEQAIAERRQLASHADPVQRLAFEELQSRWLEALRLRTQREGDVVDRRYRVIEARQTLLERQRRR